MLLKSEWLFLFQPFLLDFRVFSNRPHASKTLWYNQIVQAKSILNENFIKTIRLFYQSS